MKVKKLFLSLFIAFFIALGSFSYFFIKIEPVKAEDTFTHFFGEGFSFDISINDLEVWKNNSRYFTYDSFSIENAETIFTESFTEDVFNLHDFSLDEGTPLFNYLMNRFNLSEGFYFHNIGQGTSFLNSFVSLTFHFPVEVDLSTYDVLFNEVDDPFGTGSNSPVFFNLFIMLDDSLVFNDTSFGLPLVEYSYSSFNSSLTDFSVNVVDQPFTNSQFSGFADDPLMGFGERRDVPPNFIDLSFFNYWDNLFWGLDDPADLLSLRFSWPGIVWGTDIFNYITSFSIVPKRELSSIYIDGYNAGYERGISAGKIQGYEEGFIDGQRDGIAIGRRQASDYSFLNFLGAVVDAPVRMLFGTVVDGQRVGGLFTFEILGIDISAFLLGLLSITIVIFIVKLII